MVTGGAVMNVCGLICPECTSYNNECKGCSNAGGKVYWTGYLPEKICPIYACVAQKGLPDCGICEKLPCDIWQSLKDPALSSSEFQETIKQRMENLSRLHKHVD